MNLVFTIVVSYNGMPWIEKCLNSLLNSQLSTEIILVDNGSSDGTKDFVLHNYPSVHVLEARKNLGFGMANNLGIAHALQNSADYVFLLNQDAWIEPETIKLLHHCMLGNPQLGIVSPIHLNGKGKAIDLYFSNYLSESDTKGFLTNIILKSVPFRPYIKTSFVNAAAWLISRECIIKTGGFDPIFFHYGEDRNYSQRVLFWGFEIGIVTRAFIFHDREDRLLLSQSVNKLDKKKEWEHFLTNACDIKRMDATAFMAKRFLRHSLQAMFHLITFDMQKFSVDFFIVKKIATSAPAIYASRRRSRKRDSGIVYTKLAKVP